MTSFDFVITISVCQSILPHLTPLSDHLQDLECDLVLASSRGQTICDLMQQKRNDATWSDIWQSATCLAQEQDIPVVKPRVTGHQMHRSNIPAVTVEEYRHLNLFNPFIDQLIAELRERDCVNQWHD